MNKDAQPRVTPVDRDVLIINAILGGMSERAAANAYKAPLRHVHQLAVKARKQLRTDLLTTLGMN